MIEDLSKVEIVSPILRNKGIRSMVGIPLLVKERVVGSTLVRSVRQFTSRRCTAAKFVADCKLAIEHLEISRPLDNQRFRT